MVFLFTFANLSVHYPPHERDSQGQTTCFRYSMKKGCPAGAPDQVRNPMVSLDFWVGAVPFFPFLRPSPVECAL